MILTIIGAVSEPPVESGGARAEDEGQDVQESQKTISQRERRSKRCPRISALVDPIVRIVLVVLHALCHRCQ